MKKHKNFVDELKDYLENTPREEILIAWKKASEWNDVGPTCDEHLKQSKVNLKLMEKQLDDALNAETKESLTEFIMKQRK